MKIRKREIFRWTIDFFDSVNFWFRDRLNLDPKRSILEAQQELISVEELERTIGKSLGITKDT